MNDIIVTKLPKSLDPYIMVEEKIIKECGIRCPFCGSEDISNPDWNYKTWYGKHDKHEHPLTSELRLWEKDHHWKQIHFTCYDCGAEWKSPAFIHDVLDIKEMNKIYRESLNKEEL